MPEKPDDKPGDTLLSDSYELTALVNILERKGLIDKAEFLEEVTRLKKEVKQPVEPDPYIVRG